MPVVDNRFALAGLLVLLLVVPTIMLTLPEVITPEEFFEEHTGQPYGREYHVRDVIESREVSDSGHTPNTDYTEYRFTTEGGFTFYHTFTDGFESAPAEGAVVVLTVKLYEEGDYDVKDVQYEYQAILGGRGMWMLLAIEFWVAAVFLFLSFHYHRFKEPLRVKVQSYELAMFVLFALLFFTMGSIMNGNTCCLLPNIVLGAVFFFTLKSSLTPPFEDPRVNLHYPASFITVYPCPRCGAPLHFHYGHYWCRWCRRYY